ncbi:MAGUK p55 subfamily member 7-like [Ptychodera flava]|uniref:MAGUK p55 subfamily member 7-like n=1 Tax=Ptychodera flava TaxID=63121 RepID=UPI00396A56C2
MPALAASSTPSSPTPSKHDPGLQRLLASLDQLQNKVDGKEDDLTFLKHLFQSQDIQALLKIHSKVSSHDSIEPCPVAGNASQTAYDLADDLRNKPTNTDAKELYHILANPFIRTLLEAHDTIANKDFLPKLPDLTDLDEGEPSVKIVRLVKSNEPLGATIKCDEETGMIVIARIMHGGAADRSGVIHVGDEVHEVNGIPVRGKEPDDVVGILAGINGTITFKLVPADMENRPCRESQVRMRAHFDYDPMEDRIIPCKEAGLAFEKGDILHIVNQEDPSWWQARKEGDRNQRAGLIPGKQLQERREALKRTIPGSPILREMGSPNLRGSGRGSSLRSSKRKTRKIMYHTKENDEYDNEEILVYEEVIKYKPPPGRYRPIVLIGAPGIGRNELKRRLIASDPSHFKATIPHTSRPKKPTEVESKEYHFLSRQQMEADIQNNKFIEHGEYKGNLYGTSLDSIYDVVNAAKVCILNVHPQALKMLKISDVKPYVVFVKPPSLERLRVTRLLSNAKSTLDATLTRTFTDEELQEMLATSQRIESVYSHYFDYVLVNDDLQVAYSELRVIAYKIENEPQWVPSFWVR